MGFLSWKYLDHFKSSNIFRFLNVSILLIFSNSKQKTFQEKNTKISQICFSNRDIEIFLQLNDKENT